MQELPNKISEYIQNDGQDLLNGYIRFIQPQNIDVYRSLFEGKHFWKSDIPFAITAFGDIIAWNSDGFIQLYRLVDGISSIMMYGDKFFFQNILDKDFQKDFFELELFKDVQEKYGKISADQCYAFIPLPALGGDKGLDSVRIASLKTYLSLLIETMQ